MLPTPAQGTVAVITRTRDRPLHLQRALRSVTGQSHPRWVLVIVNDGGEPAPVERLVAELAAHVRARVRVIHVPRSPSDAAACNAGIRALAGEFDYLTLHDDADTWAPDFIAIALGELEAARARHPSIAGIVTLAHTVREHVHEGALLIDALEAPPPVAPQARLVSLAALLAGNVFAPIQFLYRAEGFKAIGPYREDLPVLADWEFNLRFLSHFDILAIPQALAFRHHATADAAIQGVSIPPENDEHHEFVRQLLRNEWLRDDLRRGGGLGLLAHIHAGGFGPAAPVAGAPLPTGRSSWRSALPGSQLLHYWLQSGRPGHYLRKFLLSLFTQGPATTFATVRLWLATRRARGDTRRTP